MQSQEALHKKSEPPGMATEQNKSQRPKPPCRVKNVAMKLIFLHITEIEEFWGMSPNIGARYQYQAGCGKNKLQLQVSKQDILT